MAAGGVAEGCICYRTLRGDGAKGTFNLQRSAFNTLCTIFAHTSRPRPIPVADTDILSGKAAAYFTLGCKLNYAETAAIENQLSLRGVHRVARDERADICIINTCSVTEVADHKCRQAIHRLTRQHPDALVVVTGCYAQLEPGRVASIDGVDLVLGQNEKADIVARIEQRMALPPEERRLLATEQHAAQRVQDITRFVPSCARGERTRFFLKVQDGCDYYCTYCTIPFARGRSRNGSIASLVEQARDAAARGGKEVVITGVNIGDYGRTTGETLLQLLEALDTVAGICRYRISSIEPNLLTDDILQFCASSRAFMPHFHIPLQSGSDEVLRLMHRRYDTELFYNKVTRVRELMPDAFIGVDVIVGTRGETAPLFAAGEHFIASLPVSQLHVFSYSERPGTAALHIPHSVSAEEKHERSQCLLALSEQKLSRFYESYMGHTRPVLLERSHTAGHLGGFTDNYIRVDVDTTLAPSVADNTIVPLQLNAWNADHTALCATTAPLPS